MVYCEDENSNTPLHLACLNSKPKTVEVLLKHGGCVNAKNSIKWTALDCAASVGAIKCAKLLLENDAPIGKY